MGYQYSILPNGLLAGSPEDALDCACGLYLNDPTAWLPHPTPTNYERGHQCATPAIANIKPAGQRPADSLKTISWPKSGYTPGVVAPLVGPCALRLAGDS
jgi:hypothetical protein